MTSRDLIAPARELAPFTMELGLALHADDCPFGISASLTHVAC
jgi:hypothetical protein